MIQIPKKLLSAVFVLVALMVTNVVGVAQEQPVAPPEQVVTAPPASASVDQILQELSTIGPEALAARVNEMKTQSQQLGVQAAELRTKAAELDAQVQAITAQVETVEKFTAALSAAMQPEAVPAPPAPEETPAAATPAPADATATASAPETPPAQVAEAGK